MNEVIAEAIAAVAANNRQGAAEIAEQAADILLRQARTGEAATPDVLRQDMLAIGWELIKAHPTMAPLVNLVNVVLWRIDTVEGVRALRQAVADIIADFKRQLRVHEAAIAESVLPLIPEGAYVLTNGRSTTVRAALRHAQRAGRRFSVICAESRPGLEGRIMAAELTRDGIPVTLVIDTLAVARVAQVQLVLVGADHLSSTNLVNKVGTYAIALVAQTNQVPIYALCGSAKFLPPGYQLPPQAHWPADQVWDDAPAEISLENLYFDDTPLAMISGVVTEQGVLTSAAIEAWLASIHLHPALAAIARQSA